MLKMHSTLKHVIPDASRQSILKNYVIGDILGSGAFSEVKRAFNKKTGVERAVKIMMKKANINVDGLRREISILTSLNHKNIIKLHEVFETDSKLYLVMELVSGGELFDRIVSKGFYTEKDAAKTCYTIVSAISYLHKLDIVHRDLKPENLLYESESDDSELKVADFGLSHIAKTDMLTTSCGTPGYVAPEVLTSQNYGKPVDMWGIGVITYILLSGIEPFYDETDAKLFGRIIKASYDYPDPYWNNVSENAKDFINKLLILNPSNRLTADQALKHPWVTGYAAKSQNMSSVMTELSKLNARRRLRVGVSKVIAVNRLAKRIMSDPLKLE